MNPERGGRAGFRAARLLVTGLDDGDLLREGLYRFEASANRCDALGRLSFPNPRTADKGRLAVSSAHAAFGSGRGEFVRL